MERHKKKYVHVFITLFSPRLDDEVFLALPDGNQLGGIQEVDAVSQVIFGGNGFVTQVEAEPRIAPQGYHPCDDKGCRRKRLLFKGVAIPLVPINKGAGTALDTDTAAMDRKSGRPARDDGKQVTSPPSGHTWARRPYTLPQRHHFRKTFITFPGPLGSVCIADMPS